MLFQMRPGMIFTAERVLRAYVNIVLSFEVWDLYGLSLSRDVELKT
jgi:hypothetical protein